MADIKEKNRHGESKTVFSGQNLLPTGMGGQVCSSDCLVEACLYWRTFKAAACHDYSVLTVDVSFLKQANM